MSQGTCPIKIVPGAPPRDRSHTYEECLRQYGKSLESGFDTRHGSRTLQPLRACMAYNSLMAIRSVPIDLLHRAALRRWLKAARRSAGKQRLNNLIQHIINTWLWTLERRQGTPCMPLVITYRCSNDASCGGIGDRIKGQSMAFWMVSVDAHDPGHTRRARVHSLKPPISAATCACQSSLVRMSVLLGALVVSFLPAPRMDVQRPTLCSTPSSSMSCLSRTAQFTGPQLLQLPSLDMRIDAPDPRSLGHNPACFDV